MALHRKIDALMALRPDLAVISESAEPGRLLDGAPELAEASLVWLVFDSVCGYTEAQT